MTDRRSVDLREVVPEPPDGLLALPSLHRKIRARQKRQSALALVATVVVVAGAVVAVTRAGSGSAPAVTHAPARNGAIVFARLGPGRSKYLPTAALYAQTPSETQARRLTPTSGRIGPLAVSPDGREIAYAAETYGYRKHKTDWHVTGDDVHVINADGSDNRTVYRCQASTCSSLTWSPVGDELLINDTAVLRPDGHVSKLCHACGPANTLTSASWSPDGKQIAFEDSVAVEIQGGTATVSAIGIANADGTHMRLLTDRECATTTQSRCAYDSEPAWSPSGHEIAFARMTSAFLRLDASRGPGPSGPTGVDMMRTDGTTIKQLAGCGTDCRVDSIQWTGDGTHLAFVTTRNSRTNGIHPGTVGVADTSMDRVDNVSVRTVSTPSHHSFVPAVAWAPDGSQLAVDSYEPGHLATISLIPVQGNTLGSPVALVSRDAHPPLTWLPAIR